METLPGARKRSHKTNKAMNAVSEWVQGHGTSCHLQVTAPPIYAHNKGRTHLDTLSTQSCNYRSDRDPLNSNAVCLQPT